MLQVKGVSKRLGGVDLLKDVTFTIGNKQKIGLIGPNGCGKSTLFNLILGELDPDVGQVLMQNEVIGFLPQEFVFEEGQTVEQFFDSLVSNSSSYWRIEKLLSHLGMNDVQTSQVLNTMSEGQKMKFKLVQALIIEPTLLLIDEPTNHLDIEGILWFEEVVQEFNGAVLMISHDRSFLDNTVDTIFEIDEQAVHIFPGNYTDYKSSKEGWIDTRDNQYKSQERKRKQLELLVENAKKIKDGKKRGKAIRAAEKRMEREVTRNEITKYQRYQMHGLDVQGSTHNGKLMLSVEQVSHSYQHHQIFKDLTFEIRGNQRVWLYGQNGAGKSTLLNIITGIITPTSGRSRIGENVTWGYFRQNQEHLSLDMPVQKYLEDELSLYDYRGLNFLQKLHFTKDHFERRLGQLSPGERARLSFGVFTNKEYSFLVLDEPTNHLDIWTKEAIEASLREYKGAVLVVSHDRYFVEQVGFDRVLNLNEGALQFMAG